VARRAAGILEGGAPQGVPGACTAGQDVEHAPVPPAARRDGKKVAATSRHLGHGRKVPRCRGILVQGPDRLDEQQVRGVARHRSRDHDDHQVAAPRRDR
jgi:hypothetical protein